MNKQTVIQWLKYVAIAAISFFLLLFVLGGLIFSYYAMKAPTLSEKDLVATTSSKIYDNQNNLIADLGAEKRINVTANEIPTDLVKAIVSIEDHRFFDHRGVDTIRIMGAALRNLQGGGGLQGASTLTQQLIKLTYFSTSTADQTLSRKAQEAWLAVQLEQKATKQEILTYYINKVYMSNGNYGMQTAAQNYYGKDLKDLSLPQLALLAGMPQAPNQYDPYSHPEAALERRNLVLSEMKGQKYISAEDYEKAILKLPKIARVKSQRGRTYGSNIYLDVVLEMNPDLSVYESHAITEEVEDLLKEEFGVFDIDVHVEPSSIPEDELIENVEKKLLTYEKRLYAKQEFDTLLADNYTLIDDTGHEHNKAELIEALASDQVQFQNFELESISQKTKLIRYELDGQIHTSLWRRHETWQKIFHQITNKTD